MGKNNNVIKDNALWLSWSSRTRNGYLGKEWELHGSIIGVFILE